MTEGALVLGLDTTVVRWRRRAYVAAAAVVAAFAIADADRRAAAAVGVLLAGAAAGLTSPRARATRVVAADLCVSVALWWLYGPVSGATLILFGVVAIAPIMLPSREARRIVVAAFLVVPLQVALHFIAGEVELPLFHPHLPVPTSEFVTGSVIQGALLIGIGILMVRLAGMLQAGRAAITADLERQKELGALKDRFVATVSHELRTPLTSLRGFAATLLADDPGPAERADFLRIMVDQTDELQGLIEDLIAFSRIESGAMTIAPKGIDLRGEVDGVLIGMEIRARTVTNEVATGTFVHADPLRVRQIVRNLVDNAVKYGRPPVVVSANRHGDFVACRVLDAGDGVADGDAESVFEPYARLVDDTTMSRPGIGLGLSIVHDLVGRHGGSVEVVHDGGLHGFEFTLPTVESETLTPGVGVGAGLPR